MIPSQKHPSSYLIISNLDSEEPEDSEPFSIHEPEEVDWNPSYTYDYEDEEVYDETL